MKRIIAMALCIALFATMAITGSVAYLTDEEKETNVFAVGNVDIIQHEQERNGSELQDFTNDLDNLRHPMVESRDEDVKHTDWTFDGEPVSLRNPDYYANYVDKIVTVENKGTSPVYLRNIIAIPTGLPEGAEDVEWLEIDWFDMPGEASSEWEQAHIEKDVEIDGVLYDIYVFNYTADEGVFEAKDTTLPTLLGFGLSKYVDYDDTEGAETYFFRDASGKRTDININPELMQILVATQTVQTAGFEDFDHAFDETFKAISKTNHPWVEETEEPAQSTKSVVIENNVKKEYDWDELVEKGFVTIDNGRLKAFKDDASDAVIKLVIPDGKISSFGRLITDTPNTSLQEVILPEGIELKMNAFKNCDALKEITIPGTVTLNTSIFDNCDNLETVIIEEGITIIPAYSFDDCIKLKNLSISSTVESIGGYAFSGCTSLTSVAFPSGMKSIGNYAFKDCANLSSITGITKDTTNINSTAFNGTQVIL